MSMSQGSERQGLFLPTDSPDIARIIQGLTGLPNSAAGLTNSRAIREALIEAHFTDPAEQFRSQFLEPRIRALVDGGNFPHRGFQRQPSPWDRVDLPEPYFVFEERENPIATFDRRYAALVTPDAGIFLVARKGGYGSLQGVEPVKSADYIAYGIVAWRELNGMVRAQQPALSSPIGN